MKTIQGEMCPWPRTATIPHSAGGSGFESRRERAMDVVTCCALRRYGSGAIPMERSCAHLPARQQSDNRGSITVAGLNRTIGTETDPRTGAISGIPVFHA